MSFDLINQALLLPMDLPDPNPIAPPGTLAQKVTNILGLLMWTVGAVCLGAAIIAGAKIALVHRRGEEGEGLKALALAAIGCIVALSVASLLTWATGQ